MRYNAALLGCVERWVESSDAARYAGKLCDILNPLLAKTGHTSHGDGAVVRMQTFHVSERNTRQVRDRVFALLEKFLFSDDPRSVLKAVKSFGTVLYNPVPFYNMEITEEECRVWASEQLRILDILERFDVEEAVRDRDLACLGFRPVGGSV